MLVMHPSVSGCTTSGLAHVGHKREKEVWRGAWEEQVWECPTVKFRACGRVRLESPQSDLSVTEHCDNTNILPSFGRTCKQNHKAADMRNATQAWELLCLFSPRVIWHLFFIFSKCLYLLIFSVHHFGRLSHPRSRCPPSISTRSGVWGGVSRKQWPALTSCVTGVRWRPNSCCPALSFPLCFPLSCFSPFQASCSREQLCLFLRHRRCLLIYEAQKT